MNAVSPESSAMEGGAAASNSVNTTVTNSLFSTQIVSIIQAASPPGVYSFTENNGTTTWLGGQTPPSTLSLLTSTAFITLQPVIFTSSSVSGESAQSTSYLTVSLTTTITETSTLTMTSSSVTSAAAGAFTGLAPNGWNATTLMSVKAAATASGSAKPYIYQVDVKDKAAFANRTACYSGKCSRKSTRLLKARQVEGDVISATINGVVVSWTNNYNGPVPSTPEATPSTSEVVPSISETSYTFDPITATAPAFGPFATSKCHNCGSCVTPSLQ